MAAAELRKEGWYVDAVKLPDALGDDYSEALSAVGLKAQLLNCDIREFGDAALVERWDKKRSELTGPVVLQLSKWCNASESKYAEHVDDEGVCVLDLTDGHLTVRGMQSDPQPLNNINGSTPYGSKILLTGKILLENNYLLLDNRNCKFLGGHVDKLVDRWNAERFGNNKNARKATGAPKWIPFGKANKGGEQPSADTKSFKAMAAAAPAQTTETTEPSERSEEFEAARKANIEMAAQERTGGKKFAQVQGVQKFKAPREEHDGDRSDARQQNPRLPPRNESQRRSPQAFGEDKTRYRSGRGGGRRARGDDEEFTAPRPPHGSTLFDYVQSQVQLPDISPPAPPEYRPYSENEQSNYGDNRSNRGGGPGRKPPNENGGSRPSHGRYNFQDSPRGQQYGGGGNGYGRRGDYSGSSSERPFSMPQNTGYHPTNKRYNGGRRDHSDLPEVFDRMRLQPRPYQQHNSEESYGHPGRYYQGNEQQQPRFVRTFTRTQNLNEPIKDDEAASLGLSRGQVRRHNRYLKESRGLGCSETNFKRSGKNSQTNV